MSIPFKRRRSLLKVIIGLILAILFIAIIIINSTTGFNFEPLKSIASKIERYPNSTKWEIAYTSGDHFQSTVSTPSRVEIAFLTNDSKDKVISFYEQKLTNDGWKKVQYSYGTIFKKGLLELSFAQNFSSLLGNECRIPNDSCKIIVISDDRWSNF